MCGADGVGIFLLHKRRSSVYGGVRVVIALLSYSSFLRLGGIMCGNLCRAEGS